MRTSLVGLFLIATFPAMACEPVSIKWNGDYPHNNEKVWTKDYTFGFSKNFLNGTPQEHGKVQREGNLLGTICEGSHTKPAPFVILMHGCAGLDPATKRWLQEYARGLNRRGIGVLILDSFTTRHVKESCGDSDRHWGQRRSEDAYSALDYLATTGKADMSNVSVIGNSGGGTATIMAMEDLMANHPNKFVMGVSIVPHCGGRIAANFYAPLTILAAGKDDANDPKKCVALLEHKRAETSAPVKLVIYRAANHGYMYNVGRTRFFHGWTLSYNRFADQDSLDTIYATIKKGPTTVKDGVEIR